jgi:hypothetical protein
MIIMVASPNPRPIRYSKRKFPLSFAFSSGFKRLWASQQLCRRGYFFKMEGEDREIRIDAIFADFKDCNGVSSGTSSKFVSYILQPELVN